MLFSSFIAGVFFGSIMYLLEKGVYTGKREWGVRIMTDLHSYLLSSYEHFIYVLFLYTVIIYTFSYSCILL